MWATASYCHWDCTVSRRMDRLFHLGNCITSQCPSLNAKIWMQTNLHACLHCRTHLRVQISSLPGPQWSELYPANRAKWCKLGASRNIERHIQLSGFKRPQKGCTVFWGPGNHLHDKRMMSPQRQRVPRAFWDSVPLKTWGEKVSAQRETWRFGDSVVGTRKEERPKKSCFLNTIKHAQIPPKVISNHFKIWNMYNFHLVWWFPQRTI